MTEDTRSEEAKRLMAYGEKVGRMRERTYSGRGSAQDRYLDHIALREWKAEQRLYKVLAGAGVDLALKENPDYLKDMQKTGIGVLRAFLKHARRELRRGWRPGMRLDPFGPTA